MTNKHALIQPDRGQKATPIRLVDKATYPDWLKSMSAGQRAAVEAQKFTGGGYEYAIVPEGDHWSVVAGVANVDSLSSWCMAKLAEVLPEGTYRRAGAEPGPALHGWVTGQYRFDRYRKDPKAQGPRVLLTTDVKAIDPALHETEAVAKVRDLVNTPTEDMGPGQLEDAVRALAKAHHAEVRVTGGDALEQQFPLVHAVGRAAARGNAPRMIELVWGKDKHPKLAIVGKGVCFDSGGLDIKPSSGMALMKKDMGGAAHAIALAQLVMQHHLKVQLHLLVPAVENVIAGNAFRPGDVFTARNGTTVEITNTDAEGRLVLADALARASEESPELIVDFATLTGAARVALGPDLPALFARRDDTAAALLAAGRARDDACWRLPLPEAYREYLKSDIADMVNSAPNGFAGASVAGLFLDRFVGEGIDWLHFDTFAWRPAAKPGRPKGGDALGLRAAWGLLLERFG